MDTNDVAVRPAKRQVILGDGTIYQYGIASSTSGAHAIRRTQAYLLRTPSKSTTIWPGEFVELDCESSIDGELALEPRTDFVVRTLDQQVKTWPLPGVVSSVANRIRIPNETNSPVILQRNKHFAQVCPIVCPEGSSPQVDNMPCPQDSTMPPTPSAKNHSAGISLDPDNILSPDAKAQFVPINKEFDEVAQISMDTMVLLAPFREL